MGTFDPVPASSWQPAETPGHEFRFLCGKCAMRADRKMAASKRAARRLASDFLGRRSPSSVFFLPARPPHLGGRLFAEKIGEEHGRRASGAASVEVRVRRLRSRARGRRDQATSFWADGKWVVVWGRSRTSFCVNKSNVLARQFGNHNNKKALESNAYRLHGQEMNYARSLLETSSQQDG